MHIQGCLCVGSIQGDKPKIRQVMIKMIISYRVMISKAMICMYKVIHCSDIRKYVYETHSPHPSLLPFSLSCSFQRPWNCFYSPYTPFSTPVLSLPADDARQYPRDGGKKTPQFAEYTRGCLKFTEHTRQCLKYPSVIISHYPSTAG